jgi:hypothetical protein
MSPSADPPFVRAGHILALRLFNVAESIDLERAATLWQSAQAGTARRHGLAATPPKANNFVTFTGSVTVPVTTTTAIKAEPKPNTRAIVLSAT